MKDEAELRRQIRTTMWALRARLAAYPQGQPFEWIIPGQLACAQRPLRDDPRFKDMKPLPLEAGPHVLQWIESVRKRGIRSVICLLHPKELQYYDSLTGMEDGLLAAYRAADLLVASIPWPDPAHAKTSAERERLGALVYTVKIDAAKAFRHLEKPVLVHCSAAIDRSTPVAAYIAAQID